MHFGIRVSGWVKKGYEGVELRMLKWIAGLLVWVMANFSYAAPGFDMGVVIQQLNSLRTQIRQLTQLQGALEQLRSMTDRYSLEQISSLGNIFDMNSKNLNLAKEKSRSLQDIIAGGISNIPERDPSKQYYTDQFFKAVEPEDRERISQSLKRYQHQPDSPEEVMAKARSLGIDSNELEKKSKENYDIYEKQIQIQKMAEKSSQQADIRIGKITELDSSINSLGKNSDLATLQLIARENVQILHQNEEIIKLLGQLIASQESPAAQQAALEAKWQQEEFDRLERRKNQKISPKAQQELKRTSWGKI